MASNYDELYHYGVLGMHWGIRRYQPYPTGHTGGKEVGQAAKTKKKKYVYPSADINSMSNEELRRKVNRMNLEKRYADMSTQKYVRESKAQKVSRDVSNKASRTNEKHIKTGLKVFDAGVSVATGKPIGSSDMPNKDTLKKAASNIRATAKGVAGANNIVQSAQRINRVDYRNEKMHEATKMSYKELQSKVNRMDMERQYKELEKSAYTTKGKQVLEELWPILMATGAIGGGVYGGANTAKSISKFVKTGGI